MLACPLILLAACARGGAAGTDPASPAPICQVELVPSAAGADAIATFGHAFKRGDVTNSIALAHGSRPIETQVDVKRRYDDGSVKHAVVTAVVPASAGNAPLLLDVVPAERVSERLPSPAGLPQGLTAQVCFRFPDGSEHIADLRTTFAAATGGAPLPYRARTWLEGPLVTEYQVAGPPLDAEGNLDPDLWVIFGVRVYRGGKGARVEVVTENCWADSPGNVPYHVRIVLAGEEMYGKTNVGRFEGKIPYWLEGVVGSNDLGHHRYARWRKIFWWGERPPAASVRYHVPYLVSTGLVPKYDTTVRVSEKALLSQGARWEEAAKDILDRGIICGYFPTTGGREDLGPYPTWTTRYLLSQDPRALPAVLGTGDLAGSFDVHVRDRQSGRILSLDEHPGFSLNPRGTLEEIPPRSGPPRPYLLPAASPYRVDCAHQPSLAFVPYLLTGDYYYLEEAYFWANWCMLIQNASYRDKQQGLLHPDQTRGEAWALRQLVDAAKIAPDDASEKPYFDDKVRSNLNWYREFVTGPEATPLGTYTAGASDAYVRGRPAEERRKWLTLAPWQQNFLVWSLEHAVTAGYQEAAPARDYFAKLQIGMLTNPGDFDPRCGAPYFLAVGERENEEPRYYSTWKELYHKTFEVVDPEAVRELEFSSYGGSYSFIARAVLTLARGADLPDAEAAFDWLDSRLEAEEVLAEDPTWALVP